MKQYHERPLRQMPFEQGKSYQERVMGRVFVCEEIHSCRVMMGDEDHSDATLIFRLVPTDHCESMTALQATQRFGLGGADPVDGMQVVCIEPIDVAASLAESKSPSIPTECGLDVRSEGDRVRIELQAWGGNPIASTFLTYRDAIKQAAEILSICGVSSVSVYEGQATASMDIEIGIGL